MKKYYIFILKRDYICADYLSYKKMTIFHDSIIQNKQILYIFEQLLNLKYNYKFKLTKNT